jgi:hypothetical protein
MSDKANARLEQQLRQLERDLPRPVSRVLRWLRAPSARWARIPLALALMCGGILGFMPALGFWMLPLGLLLLSQDVPFLRRPTSKALAWLERCWEKWKPRRRQKS